MKNVHLWLNCLQKYLFPALEESLGTLSPNEQKFVRIVEFCELGKYMDDYSWCGIGRKPVSRLNLVKAFIAKVVWNIPTTEALIDRIKSSPTLRRLCGWESVSDVPNRSTFSRAFSEFANGKLPDNIHKALIENTLGDKLIGHASIDSTAINAREKPERKPAPEPTPKPKKRGRPRKDEHRAPPEPKRLDIQLDRSMDENIADLPTACNVGCKRNSKGYKEAWTGYKMHISSTDFDVPICAILTSASLHDSQVAIPLMQMTKQATPLVLYDLMDAAYDASQIAQFSRSLEHQPIIDPNPRGRKEPRVLAPHEKSRIKERSSVERVNSNLKDNWGGRFVRVKGAAKVACHLMFGILAMTADRLIGLLS